MSSSVRIGLLGPLIVQRADKELVIGAPKQRALLALLALDVGRALSTDELAEKLWARDPPDSAAAALQVYVSQLRKLLGSDAIITRRPGYALSLPAEAVDIVRFRQQVAQGRSDVVSGEPGRALEALNMALSSWRGPALAEFLYEDWAAEPSRQLEELRLDAIEDRIEAQLQMGQGTELTAELETLARNHPLRERLRAQQMLALYRAGRQADALAVYRDARTGLVDELGIEPSPSLVELHRRILGQDPSLDGTQQDTSGRLAVDSAAVENVTVSAATGKPVNQLPGRRLRAKRVGALAAALIIALSVVAVVALTRRSDASSGKARLQRVEPNTLVRIDPQTDQVSAIVPTGPNPDEPTPTPGGLIWVLTLDGATALNETTRHATNLRGLSPSGIAFAHPGSILFASSATNTLWSVDANPDPGHRLIGRSRITFPSPIRDVAYVDGSIWVNSPAANKVYRVNPASDNVEAVVHLGVNPSGYFAYGDGSVWAPNNSSQSVTRIDVATDQTTTIHLHTRPSGGEGYGPAGVAYGFGKVWVSISGVRLACIDPQSNTVVRMIRIGKTPYVWGSGVAVGFGHVWVANGGDGTISRVDPQTGAVSHIAFGRNVVPIGVAADHHGIWATLQSTS
jgi:DNA-binding SARP family transcriptional activator